MKVRLTRSGGQLGVTRVLADVDTTRLDAEQRKRIESAVAAAQLFTLQGELTPDAESPDAFGYEITAQSDDGRSTTISFALPSASESLRALVTQLRSLPPA